MVLWCIRVECKGSFGKEEDKQGKQIWRRDAWDIVPIHQSRQNTPLSFILVQMHYGDEEQSGHSLLIVFFHEGIIMSTLQFQFLLAKYKENQDS